jgi:O-antigen/teichoic acid export membrane protein
LILDLKPKTYWKDFKVVISFSLALFALGVFQATATQSRPIILSIFSNDGAGTVAEFRIVEVIPQFVIMLSGTFSGIFLPKAAEMVAKHDQKAIEDFAYKWTSYTTIIVNLLVFPFIIGGRDALSAYVGPQYGDLAIWLYLWLFCVLLQMHTTPGNALVLSYGKTRLLVITTAVACVLSIVINALLSKRYGVGSAVIGYTIYIVILSALYYISFYKKLLHLSNFRLFSKFLVPTLIGIFSLLLTELIPFNDFHFWGDNRFYYIAMLALKSVVWFIPYSILISLFKLFPIRQVFNRK